MVSIRLYMHEEGFFRFTELFRYSRLS